ncbi:MAG: hypothetical protein K6F71_05490 [Ruminococcus sp.]|uniref:hypothetical protein n=1 Tax=Ruminococcus sp. TaxID=41978 RepID=UPI0025E472AD|nr:hypothetical protein [Ruminococcus sp.]MCR5540265.1 hypothetical protein [Ruminococcus sp.]
MRFSEGIKRYDEETKKRIFDEIIAAAEKNSAAGNSHAGNETAVIAQQNTEGNTMKNTEERAKIRSSKGGVIAAACAVLVVGGGIFAAGHMNGGSKGTAPGSAGTTSSVYTTDAEDEVSSESTAEEDEASTVDETSTVDEADSMTTDDIDYDRWEKWREEADEDTIRLVDSSDFIGMVQIEDIRQETIDGVEYTDYQCVLEDEEGHCGLVFALRGDELPTKFGLLEKTNEGDQVLAKGDKIFVFAKNGVQNGIDEFCYELTDDYTMFRWNDEVKRYTNVYRPGHIITDTSEGIYGDYLWGLYEMGLDNYYKDMLWAMCSSRDLDAVKNWCAYYGLPFEIVVESGQDFKAGSLIGISWANTMDQNGITVSVSDGLSFIGENDNGEESQVAIELNVRDKGTTIKEFADYNLELGGLFYEKDENNYGVVIDVTKKDGSKFSYEDWAENHMDLVYGDLDPIMSLTYSSYMDSGLSWLADDGSKMRVACVFHAKVDFSYVDSSVPLTLQVNKIRREKGEEEEGLFEATFNIDITDVK